MVDVCLPKKSHIWGACIYVVVNKLGVEKLHRTVYVHICIIINCMIVEGNKKMAADEGITKMISIRSREIFESTKASL